VQFENLSWMLVGFGQPRSQQRENYKRHQGSELEVVELKGGQWMEVELRRKELE